MFKKMIFVLSLCLCVSGTIAQGLCVKITSYPKEVLPNAPRTMSVDLELENTSGKPVTLAYGYHGFSVAVVVSRSNGKPITPCPQAAIKPVAGFRLETKPADWREEITYSLPCWPSDPGEYLIQATVSSTGPYIQVGGEELSAWVGEVKSEEVRVRIVEPIRFDRDAFKAYHGEPLDHPDELLKRFPASTYAAWALWGEGETWYNGGTMPKVDAEKEFDFMKLQARTYKNNERELEADKRQIFQIITPWERLYRDFPDFALRPQLLLGLSRCYFKVAEPQKAAAILKELLTKFPDSDPAKKGMAYRDVLKAHGLWSE